MHVCLSCELLSHALADDGVILLGTVFGHILGNLRVSLGSFQPNQLPPPSVQANT